MWFVAFPVVLAATGVALFNPSMIFGTPAEPPPEVAMGAGVSLAPVMDQPTIGTALHVGETASETVSVPSQDIGEEISMDTAPAVIAALPAPVEEPVKPAPPMPEVADTAPSVEEAVAEAEAEDVADPAPQNLPTPVVAEPEVAVTEPEVAVLEPVSCMATYGQILTDFAVRFDSLTSVIPENEHVRLLRVIRSLPECSDAIVEVTGFADDGRPLAQQAQLGWARAETVLDVFTAQGANPLMFRMRDGKPTASGSEPAGHQVSFTVRQITSLELAAAKLME